jgi:hypothetical protein
MLIPCDVMDVEQLPKWKHNQVNLLMYFFGLNYMYLKIYHEIIKHVNWLGRKIEVHMVLDFMWKNMIKTYLIKS